MAKILRWSKPVQYDLLDVFDVPAHGRLCGFGIATLDGSYNPSVPSERFLLAPWHLQGAFTRVAQQVHKNVKHLEHDTVTGGQSNAVVEFRILVDGGFPTRHLSLLPLQNFFHL